MKLGHRSLPDHPTISGMAVSQLGLIENIATILGEYYHIYATGH